MDHAPAQHSNGAGHEQSEVSVRTIVVSLIVLLVGTFFVCLLVVGIFRYFYSENKVEEATKNFQPQVPPEPRVEEHPNEQVLTIRSRETHALTSYAWVDQKAGTVRIPIDQAIDKLAKEGLPTKDFMAEPAKPQGKPNATK